jgi:hypothetical protein
MPTVRPRRLSRRLLAWLVGRGVPEAAPTHRDDTPPEGEPDFAEERTFSASTPAAQTPHGKGDEAPHWPTRTDGRPGRPV